MKKSLLALAAMTAFAGAAQAQSSVTVYGIIDVGVLSTKGTTGADATAATTTAAGINNNGSRNTTAINSSNLATSRLGFKGVEDLGGGTKANFLAEIGLTPTQNGFSGSTNASSTPMGTGYINNSLGLDNRQTYAGLESKGLGEVRVGRQYTPVHEVLCATNAGQCNGVAGDMMYSGANSTNTLTPANGIGTSYQIRASNAIRLASENISGFQAAALYSVNSTQNINDTAALASQIGQGSVNYRMSGLNLAYTGVKNLDIRFATQTTALNRDNTVATATSRTLIGNTLFDIVPSSSQGVARLEQKDQYANISYEFGKVKVALQRVDLKVVSGGAQTAAKAANQVSITAPVTPAINVWASYGSGTIQAATSAPRYSFNGAQLGGQYNLSKRTSLYGILGQVTQDAATVGNSGFKDSQYALGMKHVF
jgi:predicted porin